MMTFNMHAMSTTIANPLLLSTAFVVLVACGSRQVPSDDTSTSSTSSTTTQTSTSSETDSSTDHGSEAEAEAENNDGEAGFVPEGDLPQEPCSVFEQNCDEGEKCVPSLSPNHSGERCVPVIGDLGVGEACTFHGHETGTDDCDATSHCWPGDWGPGEHVGTCVPLCEGTPDNPSCPGQGESCIGYQCNVLGQVGIPVCMLNCDVFAQDCGEGMACYYFGGYVDYGCGVVNMPGQLGDPCEYANDCAPGYQCINGEYVPGCANAGCCTAYCALGDDASCEAAVPGTGCSEALAQPLADGCPIYGVCSLSL